MTLRIWKVSLTYKELLRAEQLAGITNRSRAEQNELTTIRTGVPPLKNRHAESPGYYGVCGGRADPLRI